MRYQLDLFGVIVPSLLLWCVVGYLLARTVSKVLTRAGFYRHVWHAALFDFSLYVSLVATLVLTFKDLVS
ncbi:DUF1656 domain-containing protein [Bradyrhizobium sp. F1.13.3]|uniref:DUF1656 domain-containing protein n=1 Tax=Bradyrhizobium sp. F1.13.3 TaxID=3156351 RepID=UPI00339B44D7